MTATEYAALIAEIDLLRRDNAELCEALDQAKNLLCDKYEFEEAAKLSQLLTRTANKCVTVAPTPGGA